MRDLSRVYTCQCDPRTQKKRTRKPALQVFSKGRKKRTGPMQEGCASERTKSIKPNISCERPSALRDRTASDVGKAPTSPVGYREALRNTFRRPLFYREATSPWSAPPRLYGCRVIKSQTCTAGSPPTGCQAPPWCSTGQSAVGEPDRPSRQSR